MERQRRGGVWLSWASIGFLMGISFIVALAIGQNWMAIAIAGFGAMILILRIYLNMRKGQRTMVGGMEALLLLALFAAAFGVTGVGITAAATGSVVAEIPDEMLFLALPLAAVISVLIIAKTRRGRGG